MAEQREILLFRLNGSIGEASGVGNNAAWMCVCKRIRPLVGSLRIAREVDCPDCSRRYQLVSTNAENPAAGRVAKIKEADSNQTLLR